MSTPASSVKPTPPGGTPPGGAAPPAGAGLPSRRAPKQPDRRLHLDDILKLMVPDGLVSNASAEHVARSRTKQYDHPLELIAAQQWKSGKAPHKLLTLESLVEWLAGKLKVPYLHIDP